MPSFVSARPSWRPSARVMTAAILLLPPLFWAGNFIAGRAVRHDVPPLTLAFLRHLLAFVCLLPFAWGAMRRDAARYWAQRGLLMRTAIAGLAAFNALIYLGLQSTPASNALLMNSVIPVLIVVLAALFYRQQLAGRQMLGLLLSCLGVFTIILHGDPMSLLSLRFSQGDVYVFGGMLSFALFSVWLRALPPEMDRLGILAVQLLIAVVVLLPFSVWEWSRGQHAVWSGTAIAATLYVSVVTSVLATLLYMAGVARVGAARASLFIHLIPLYGAVLASLLLGEALHGYHAVGMAVILAGLLCSRPPRPLPATAATAPT